MHLHMMLLDFDGKVHDVENKKTASDIILMAIYKMTASRQCPGGISIALDGIFLLLTVSVNILPAIYKVTVS